MKHIKYIFMIIICLFIISCNFDNKMSPKNQKYSETLIPEILELDKLDYIEIQVLEHNYIGYESPHWKLFKIISGKYSSEMIETEYYKTKSIISKIYLYWILRDRKWHNLSKIHNDLLNYKNNKFYFSPTPEEQTIEPVDVEYIINYDYKIQYK